MFEINTAAHPYPHLYARLSGTVTMRTIDAAEPFTRFGSLLGPHAAPTLVIAEVEPGTTIDVAATGVVHYLLRRLLTPTGADLRLVGDARIGCQPAYYAAAVKAGKVRRFPTFADAMAAGARTGGTMSNEAVSNKAPVKGTMSNDAAPNVPATGAAASDAQAEPGYGLAA